MYNFAAKTLRSGKYLAAMMAGLLIMLMAGQADAGRVKAKPSIAGSKVSKWKAKGTSFKHETLRRGKRGPVLHWQRSATKKNGTTNVVGKTWGTPFKGTEWKSGDKQLRKVTQKAADGTTRTVFSVTGAKGTTRTSIKGIPGIPTRRITSWTVGGTHMTAVRDLNANGKVVKSERRGHKAN